MEYHALVIRDGHMTLLDPPAIICRSWHPTEDPDVDGDELELDLHERGWRMCQCYSRYEPDGEFGHIAEGRLLAIPQDDFDPPNDDGDSAVADGTNAPLRRGFRDKSRRPPEGARSRGAAGLACGGKDGG